MGLQVNKDKSMIYICGFIIATMLVAFIFQTIIDKRNFKEMLKSFGIEKYYK